MAEFEPGSRNEFRTDTAAVPESRTAINPSAKLEEILRGNWQEKLQTESYEDATASLSELDALREWRREISALPHRDFYTLFENAGAITNSGATSAEQTALLQTLVEQSIGNARQFSPRVADLYQALLSELDGTGYSPAFDATANKISQLKESGDLNLLFGNASPEVKLNRIKTRLEGDLLGRRALDKRDKQQERQQVEEEAEKQPTEEQPPPEPPPATDESQPGMDEMERSKEGEQPPAIWSIWPAYGGYYKEQTFDTWNEAAKKWRQSTYTYENYEEEPTRGREDTIQMVANISAGKTVRIPAPYKFKVARAWSGEKNLDIYIDQNGDCVFQVGGRPGEGLKEVHICFIPEERVIDTPEPAITVPEAVPGLSEETLTKLQEIDANRQGSLAKARALASYTMRRLKYSNDSSFNAVYRGDPRGYAAAIDEHRQADCDVANTYFAALCRSLGIPVRHTVGHMVKGKGKEGNSRITSGTGHAWSEVWDDAERRWVRVDATPPGDPQQEKEEGEGQEVAPGDYGEQEAIEPTDEELDALREKLADLAEELSYTQEERELAEQAGIELKEARDITKEIAKAEDTRLKNGERVVDVLSQLFSLIVEARKTRVQDYTGPLRKREGGEYIEDIVAHKIGVASGEADPLSRQKEALVEKEEKEFGGFDVYIIGDKSGSMGQAVDGETKWQLQRRAEYLILSSLHRFEQNLERSNVRMTNSLTVRTEAISFTNQNSLDLDKPLSNHFQASDKVKMWRSLGSLGMGNGDVAALKEIHRQVASEIESKEAAGEKDNRLRVIIACSDGYPDDEAAVHQYAEALGKMNALVVGVGLTETASKVPITFDTPFSRGDLAKDINDLPVIVAKQIIMEAVKLFPERSKQSVGRIVNSMLAKF